MNSRRDSIRRVTTCVLVLALTLLVHAPQAEAKASKKSPSQTKTVKKMKTVKKPVAPTAVGRELEGVWASKEYYELQEGQWVKADSDLGYSIIIKGKKICPRADRETGTLQCLGGEQGYGPYTLVREGDGFVVKKDIIGSPVGDEKIIYRKGQLELITYGMGTAKYILKKTKWKP